MKAALAVLAALAAMGGAQAKPARDPSGKLYACPDPFPTNQAICADAGLRRRIEAAGAVLAKLAQSKDADVRWLAARDRLYFAIRLHQCANPQARDEGLPGHDPASCLEAVAAAKAGLHPDAGREALIADLQANRIFDAGLVERFPKAFVGFEGSLAGSVELKADGPHSLAGTFTDARTKRRYPMRDPDAAAIELAFFAVHPSIFSWFHGRFVREDRRLVFLGRWES